MPLENKFAEGKGMSAPKRNLILCVCGMAGSGKSTVARRLAQQYDLQYYSGGDALKALALERGYKPRDRGWWENGEGLRFLEERAFDRAFDEQIDRKLLEFAAKGNVVLDSWTMPWLLKEGFKIWLEASVENRAVRLAKRDGITYEKALAALKEKEEKTKLIYRRLYDFNLGEDFAPFHFILDTNQLRSSEVFEIVHRVIDYVILGLAQ
jgi:cytidylate kinase